MDEDSIADEQWCEEMRTKVEAYLAGEQVKHGRIGESPAWHVSPYVSIWAIESLARPEWIGWWVIAGDLPTDYISAKEIEPPQHPRKAVKAIAERWLEWVQATRQGREHEDLQLGGPQPNPELASLLEPRASLLIEYADDDSLWDEE